MSDFKRRFMEMKKETNDGSEESIYIDNDFSQVIYTFLSENQLRLVRKIINGRKLESLGGCLIGLLISVPLILFGEGDDLVQMYLAKFFLIGMCVIFIYATIKGLKAKITEDVKAYRGVVISKERVRKSSNRNSQLCAEVRLENGKTTFCKLNNKISKNIQVNDQVLIVPFEKTKIIIPNVVE